MERKPKIAILRWEQGITPPAFMQLEQMPGNSTNLDSYPFPVKLVEVKGAGVETVITNPSKKLLADMIELSKKLVEEEGIEAISASCGFNAIFQEEMAAALDVPVFLSSLLQVPFVQTIVGKNKAVGVVTAKKDSLTKEHLRQCGIGDDVNTVVIGLEHNPEWNKLFDGSNAEADMAVVEKEIVGTVKDEVAKHPEIGAIVLECTDLPPFAQTLRKELGMPVFDFNSMISYMAMAISEMTNY